MNKSKDLIKGLENPESKEIMKRIVEENIKKERQKNEKIKSLMSNTDYIEWLIEFTKDKEGFSDDDWIYSSEKLDDVAKGKVDDLQLFFEGIYQYSRINYIYSLTRPLGECYKIRIGDIGFEIGYLSGQGTKFYCRRILLEEMENAIDFMDIVNKKKQDSVEYIERSLEKFSNMFIELYNNGVPIEAINEALDRGMKYINKIEREKQDTEEQKILRKKL